MFKGDLRIKIFAFPSMFQSFTCFVHTDSSLQELWTSPVSLYLSCVLKAIGLTSKDQQSSQECWHSVRHCACWILDAIRSEMKEQRNWQECCRSADCFKSCFSITTVSAIGILVDKHDLINYQLLIIYGLLLRIFTYHLTVDKTILTSTNC